MKRAKQFGACILAAGFSSRMGKFKPLLPLGDKTVIERILTVSKAAGIEKIAVVTGYNREALLPVIRRYSAIEAFNDVFEQGMFSSVQKGVAALPADLDGFFVMPVDCPLVSEAVLQELMEHFEPDRFAVPCYRGKKGHPLLVPVMYRDDILGHNGTGGLKTITDRYFEKMKRIPVEHEGVVMDMDTPQAYEEIKSYLNQAADRRIWPSWHGDAALF